MENFLCHNILMLIVVFVFEYAYSDSSTYSEPRHISVLILSKKIISFVLKLRSWSPNLVWISYEYRFETIGYEGCMDLVGT